MSPSLRRSGGRHNPRLPPAQAVQSACPPAGGVAGPVRALADAYVRRREALKAFLQNRTRDASAGEDLLQDLWLRIERVRGQVPDDPDAYLQTMAVNLARDWLAGQTRRTLFHNLDGAAVDHVPDVEPDAEQALASRQAVAFLLGVVERLPARRRQALLLYRFEGLPVAEVARRMGVSRRTAEHQVASAIATCHAELVAAGFRP